MACKLTRMVIPGQASIHGKWFESRSYANFGMIRIIMDYPRRPVIRLICDSDKESQYCPPRPPCPSIWNQVYLKSFQFLFCPMNPLKVHKRLCTCAWFAQLIVQLLCIIFDLFLFLSRRMKSKSNKNARIQRPIIFSEIMLDYFVINLLFNYS